MTDSTPTSGVDASIPDVARPIDSSPPVVDDSGGTADATFIDASDANDSGPPRFCQTISPAPAFCADFDDPVDILAGSGWSVFNQPSGSSLTYESPFLSAPRSLHATTTSGNEAFVARDIAITNKPVVQFDVRFAALPADGIPLSPIVLTPPNPPGEDLFWFVDANGSYFQEYGSIDNSGPAPTIDTWHRIVFDLTLNSSSSTTITATVDGVAEWSNKTLPYPWPTPTTATIRVGAARVYANGNNLYIDNVVVRTQ
jgi:hypothetical protein